MYKPNAFRLMALVCLDYFLRHSQERIQNRKPNYNQREIEQHEIETKTRTRPEDCSSADMFEAFFPIMGRTLPKGITLNS